MSERRAPRCGDNGYRRKDGNPCGGNIVPGKRGCYLHVGMPRKKAKAEGAIVVEVMRWGLGDTTVDPGETLLRLLSQSSVRAEKYAGLLEQSYMDEGVAALVGLKLTPVADGIGVQKLEPTEEYLRGLVQLEAQERDRCAKFAKLALDAGIAERAVRIAESQASQINAFVRGMLVALGHDPTDPEVRGIVANQMRVIDMYQ